jgi:hypothetical protein
MRQERDPLYEIHLTDLTADGAGRRIRRVIFLCRRADVWRTRAHDAMEWASLLALTALFAIDQGGWWWLAAAALASGATALTVSAWRCRRLANRIDGHAGGIARGDRVG